MPIIKVWGLAKQTDMQLKRLEMAIVSAAFNVEKLGLKEEKDISVLFPSDMRENGLGEEIIIEISGLYEKDERTSEVKNDLAQKVGNRVLIFHPHAQIECFINSFDPAQGFWSSRL